MTQLGKWKYHTGYKWWEYSIGTGLYVAQKTRSGWLVMRVPFMGNPTVLSSHTTKQAAFKAAERAAR